MRKFVIVTDSCCDLPKEVVAKESIDYVSLIGVCNDGEYQDDFGQTLTHESFYERMAQGEQFTTSQPSTQDFCEMFTRYASQEVDVIYLGVSSGLSGTCGGAAVAKAMVQEEYPAAVIHLVDTRTASLGQGILVLEALALQKSGKLADEIVEAITEKVRRFRTYMTVNDLGHLVRGGRLTKLQAAIGGLLNVKPMLRLTEEGKVEVLTRIRGRKKALTYLVERIVDEIKHAQGQVISISHGHCLEDALEIKRMVLERVQVKDVLVHFIGPVVGVYGGVGALAVSFAE
ncbi:DegV family protein [Aneurinibacillus sp. REN35]|uniref:DegV family protein n=1 Tax=Aneurinibacillus sp. REN35 TaxID=3237286 RepID=UPI003527A6C5